VDSKYDNLWVDGVLMRFMGCMVWGFGKMSGRVGVSFQVIRFEVGDGNKIRFWHDVWCGDQALKEACSDLYSIVCVKDASVDDHLALSSGSL
jgi:hypothetical protein